MTQVRIPGGYYLKAKIQCSKVAHAAPCVREVWDWLLMTASYKETDVKGCRVERGQTATCYQDIQEALSWSIGFRKLTYSRHDIENAIKFLRKAGMITTSKATHGLIITVSNYSEYQNPRSYKTSDSHTESHSDNHSIIYKEESKERKSFGPKKSDRDSLPEIKRGVDAYGNVI